MTPFAESRCFMDLHDFRRNYLMDELDQTQLKQNPFEQFEVWMREMLTIELADPTAMTLATVNTQGEPSQRIVLLKSFDQSGFTFFTNQQSEKSKDIVNNASVSLHFPWNQVERQVLIKGKAEAVTESESDNYFASRPRESQLAAWASNQSSPIQSRTDLMDEYEAVSRRFPGEVPRPPHWGGYRVKPSFFEFWQGGANRLHNRFIYTLESEEWMIQRLSP